MNPSYLASLSRRGWLRAALVFTTTVAFTGGSLCAATAANNREDGPVLKVGEDVAVVPTQYGKVRGFVLNGITNFRGIPYGADTSGDRRFMPPQPPASWEGVRPALWWGASAPQDMTNRYADQVQSFVDHWNYDEMNEDCLKLNIWTPGVNDGKKRPVMVWLHGGGFVAGNAIEQDGYDGENLSRKGDVVFISINHRLGALGFSNFAGINDSFAHSGNVGMLDIVAALRWVRDNVANFGGDPNNVTISGQSGGGAKVCTLMAMPEAKGLFHKAFAMSGSSLRGVPKDYSEALGKAVLQEAGVKQVSDLQKLPWGEYIRIAAKAQKRLQDEMPMKAGRRGGFSPVSNGVDLPLGDFFAEPGFAAEIPLILSSTFNETSPSRNDAANESITLEGVKEKLRPRFGEATDSVLTAYAKHFTHAKPVELWSLIASNRQGVVAAANAKAALGGPVYVAWFGYQPELFDGRMRAFHCLDISFWFANTDRMYTHTGGGAKPRALAEQMSDATIQFMKTGNPNGGSLPKWPRYTPEKGETMVLNTVSEVKNDPDGPARRALPSP